ncbi:MAG: hypothetical protein VX279_01800 [Candidatus Neomarinimicrobiota bacterium]|nr:hypothetical protein [Candidatus Neomarinimicrobiota bacterium]
MSKIFQISLLLVLISFTYSQDNTSRSLQGAFGAVTIDGKIWNQIALRPIIPIGKISLALDIVFYIDQNGNVHDDEWDFSSGEKSKNSIIDKVYYIRYGKNWDPFYLQIGALDRVTMGYGILVNGYSNTILYPQVRKVGMEAKFRAFGLKFYSFTNDFKENFGLTGFRVSGPAPGGLDIGAAIAVDRNQYLGLRDSDGDGRPDLVDDFPDNNDYWLDTDGDGLADVFSGEWDIDGDGVTDTLDSDVPGWDLDTTIVLDTDIRRKPEPLNVNEKTRSVYAFSIDASKQLLTEKNMNVSVYTQFAALIGNTTDPVSGNDTTLGTGIIPFGLSTKFGPARFNFEYRVMPTGRFEFGYWDRSYEIERATFSATNIGLLSGANVGEIITKDSKLGKFGKQKGYFSTLNLDLGSLISASMSYQNLFGEQWDENTKVFIQDRNQSFLASVGLKNPISRITSARWYYQQRNVPNPFDFDYTESTITGYRVGIKLGNGMILNYIFRRSFRDINGDGKVNGPDETINMTSIETSFSF